MSTRKRILIVIAIALTALFMIPAMAFASPTRAVRAASASATKTVNLAFTGVVPGTSVILTGGLGLNIRSDGYFNGNFHLPDGTQVSVSGELKSNGAFNITFYNMKGMPYIKGVGAPNSSGEFVGTFKVYNKDWQVVANGIWSALPVAYPSDNLSLAFVGVVGNTTLSGAIVLDDETLMGTFNEPNGAILPVSAKLLTNNKDGYVIRVNFGDGAIIGYGKSVSNPANGLDKGFAGPFTITANGAQGKWVAYLFNY